MTMPMTIETSANYASYAARSMLWAGHLARGSLVGAFLFVNGLSTCATASTYQIPRPVERTTTAPAGEIKLMPTETSAAAAVLEIRRRSGLTWEELGDLFNVSRRSVHHWASGNVVSSGHEQLIRRTLAVLRTLDITESARTRNFLLSSDQQGVAPIDLLKAGQFDEVVSRAGDSVERITLSAPTPLSRAAKAAREPAAPASLLGAIQDRPQISSKGRIARVVRVPKAD
jgi:DNA-binding transcriptional regulator YiaG